MRISDWSSDVCSSDLTRVLPGGLATKRRESREMFEPFAPDRRDAAKLVGGGGPRFARPHHRHTVAAARNGIGNRKQGAFGPPVVAMKTRQGEKQTHLRNSPVRRIFSHSHAASIPHNRTQTP